MAILSYVFDIDRSRAIALTEKLIENVSEETAGLVRDKLANHDWTRETNLRDFWFDCYDLVHERLPRSVA